MNAPVVTHTMDAAVIMQILEHTMAKAKMHCPNLIPAELEWTRARTLYGYVFTSDFATLCNSRARLKVVIKLPAEDGNLRLCNGFWTLYTKLVASQNDPAAPIYIGAI